MENFCYWRIKQNKYSESYICTGRLFAGHTGNCPYKRAAEATLKCPEILLRKKDGSYEKPKINFFSGPPSLTLIPHRRTNVNSPSFLNAPNRSFVSSRSSDFSDVVNNVCEKETKEEIIYETE